MVHHSGRNVMWSALTLPLGQGADEFFGGYPVYLPAFLSEPDPSWITASLSEEEREKKYAVALSSPATGPQRPIGCDSPMIAQRTEHVPAPAYISVYAQLPFSEWTRCYGTCDPHLTLAENIGERVRAMMRTKWHPLNSALYSWYKTNLPNLLLTSIGDRTEMAHSIEGRTPFLDHHLVEYVNCVPPSLKIKYNADTDKFVEKWVLREASKPFITEELYQRKKHVRSIVGPWCELHAANFSFTAVLCACCLPGRRSTAHRVVSSHH